MKTRTFVGMVVVAAVVTSTLGQSLKAGERVPLAVIVAKTSGLNELSSAQLTRMYMGELVDSGGNRLIPRAVRRSARCSARSRRSKAISGFAFFTRIRRIGATS